MAPSAAAFCRRCDYPLAGVTANICPECGRPFDPADPRTFAARPGIRRRRWLKRAAWLLGIIALAELFAPSRVARMTWSWPNPDGVTATSATRWCLVAPRWLPIRYPRWTSATWTKQIEARGLTFVNAHAWLVTPCWVWSDGASSAWIPRTNNGGVIASWMGPQDTSASNLDRLCDDWLSGRPPRAVPGAGDAPDGDQ